MGAVQSNIQKFSTISERVQFLAEKYPDKELFVFYQEENRDSYTSQQLFQLAGKFANRLRHLYGFKRHDVISNTLPNSPERLITDLGIILAGCTSLNGQTLLADGSDFFRSAKNSRCNGVVLRPEEGVPAWRLVNQYVKEEIVPGITKLSCDKAPDMTSAIYVTRKNIGSVKPLLEDLRTSNEKVFVEPTITQDDVIVIFTTSGSTGYSKLVPRSHASIIDTWSPVMALDLPYNVLYSDRSLGWVGGFPFGTYCNGDKRVLLDWYDGHGTRSGEEMWRAVSKEKCSVTFIFPLDFDNMYKYVQSIGGPDFKISTMVTGGQPIKKNQIAQYLQLSDQVMVGYGSTEACLISAVFLKDTNIQDFHCGKPLDGVLVRIINDSGQDCSPKEMGTVLVKGKTVFKGFFNRIEVPDPNTAKSFTKDGFFCTEDVGYFDEDKNVYIVGRSKDTIIYGAYVVYPGWLEAKIITHPDVVEASVVPVSDPVLYQNICACVKPAEGSNLTEENIKKFCEEIFVADLRNEGTPMPKYFLILDNFPKTFTGKSDKLTLTKIAEEKFGYKGNNQ